MSTLCVVSEVVRWWAGGVGSARVALTVKGKSWEARSVKIERFLRTGQLTFFPRPEWFRTVTPQAAERAARSLVSHSSLVARMKPTAPLLVRSPLHEALFALPTKAVTATTGTVSGVWGEHKALVLSTAAVLALLAPMLLRLPRKAGITAAVLVVALLQMAFDMPPDQVLLESSVVLCLTGVLGLKDVLEGFSSDGVVAVGVMCAVAKGVQCTGGLELLARVLLGKPRGHMWAMVRLLLPVLAISAFMNNTPVCAMFMPIVTSWATSLGIPATQMSVPHVGKRPAVAPRLATPRLLGLV